MPSSASLPVPERSLVLRSLVSSQGELTLSLVETAVPQPQGQEVLIQVEAAPLNPSDHGLLFGAADLSTVRVSGSDERPVVTALVPSQAMRSMAGRAGQPMAVGNEGAGLVVAAGPEPAAQALLGRRVAALGGGMYAQHRVVPAAQCLLLPEGASAIDGASSFVNPLTALGMVDTMRREGHSALVHTAAASNLGQMLNRICRQDSIGLVNIVRSSKQADLLLSQGAVHVCDSSAPHFADDLVRALDATGATLAFDAVGGGALAGQILGAMETVLVRRLSGYSRYGSPVHKQVYVYGGLDTGPTQLARNFGMAWGMGGWLMFPYLHKIGPAATEQLKQRVAAELTTTFRSHYSRQVGLAEALSLAHIRHYAQRNTGEKFLILPQQL